MSKIAEIGDIILTWRLQTEYDTRNGLQ